MKKITALILVIIFISCVNEKPSRVINSVNIEKFEITSTSIRAIKAIDENNLFFAGSNGWIGYTDNAGRSWVKNKLSFKDTLFPNFRSIAINNNNVFALSISSPALLYKINKLDTTIVYSETHDKVFYDSLHFFEDGIHAIAVGDPTEDCPSIILSSDSGNSWKKISCDKLPKFENDEAFFAASNTNIKTIGKTVWIASGGKKARILKSDNFGKSWEIYNTPIIQGQGPQGIYSIDMFNSINGIIIGGDYSKPKENNANKAITKDGGKTWQLVSDGENPNYKSCIKYIPNTNGKGIIAIGKTGISLSNDGGITWKDISNESYYTIDFIDENSAWVAGNEKIGKLIFNYTK